jgi:hypothetical protein
MCVRSLFVQDVTDFYYYNYSNNFNFDNKIEKIKILRI